MFLKLVFVDVAGRGGYQNDREENVGHEGNGEKDGQNQGHFGVFACVGIGMIL